MILTDGELMGITAMVSDDGLPGIRSTATREEDALEARAGLTEKGILDEQGRVTPLGGIVVRLVAEYRRADRHVFANQLKASINEDGTVAVLHPAPEGWGLWRTHPAQLLTALLRSYPFLLAGDVPKAVDGPWETVTLEEWATARVGWSRTPALVVRETWASRRISRLVAYDVVGNSGFAYDLGTGKGQSLSIRDMRMRIAEAVGLQLREDAKEWSR